MVLISVVGATVVSRAYCEPETPKLILNRNAQTGVPKLHAERFAESRFLRKRDQFSSLDRPEVIAASEAAYLRDTDEVLGFVVDGVARAYPAIIAGYHHVINDRIGDTHLTVTF